MDFIRRSLRYRAGRTGEWSMIGGRRAADAKTFMAAPSASIPAVVQRKRTGLRIVGKTTIMSRPIHEGSLYAGHPTHAAGDAVPVVENQHGTVLKQVFS